MSSVKEIYTYLDRLFPRSLSCEWDNDGLMVFGKDTGIEKALITLDVTEKVAEYAIKQKYGLIISHHPLLFKPLKAINYENTKADIAVKLLSAGISVISLHTRFDAGDGGMNDALSALLGLKINGSFGPCGEPPAGRLCDAGNMTFSSLCSRVKNVLGAPDICVAKACDTVNTVAVIGGDGKDFFSSAKEAGADTVITGSAGYNAMLDAMDDGLSVIAAGHFYTESQPFINRIKALLLSAFPALKADASPVGDELIHI